MDAKDDSGRESDTSYRANDEKINLHDDKDDMIYAKNDLGGEKNNLSEEEEIPAVNYPDIRKVEKVQQTIVRYSYWTHYV